MKIRYSDKNITNVSKITNANSIDQFFFPNMKIGFELYQMHVRKAKGTWYYPTHDHPMYEINIVTEGKQILEVKGSEYVLEAGDLVLISPGVLHSSSGTGTEEDSFTYFCIHFNVDDKLLLPYIKEKTEVYYQKNTKLARNSRPLLDRLMNFSNTSQFNFREKMNLHSIMFELLGVIVTCLEEQHDEDFEKISERTFRVAYQIADIIDALIRRPGNPDELQESVIRIEEIADELDFSVSYCNKVFKKVFNMSPRQYVSFRKLNEAKSLLTQDRYSVEQIAFMMGYHDASHFSRQFKRWTGVSPSQYRQQQKPD